MKKRTLKLINNEHLNKKATSTKACDETSIDICYDSNSDYANCEVHSYDICNKDYVPCVEHLYDYCAVEDYIMCSGEPQDFT